MFESILENVKQKSPIVHNITNTVTVNDCANMVLACGASPIMADDVHEVEEITSICAGLNINIGKPDSRMIYSMLKAGKMANALGHPVVLDPVGVGVSSFRKKMVQTLLNEVKFDVIRGNISEIKSLALGCGTVKGVDADECDQVNEKNLDQFTAFAKSFAKQIKTVLVISGAVDIVTDGEVAYIIRNGHKMMSSVTGTGCQLSALTAAFISANSDQILKSAAAAACAMGLAGEIAYQRMSELDGNASYRNYVIDAIYNLTPEQLEGGAKYEVR